VVVGEVATATDVVVVGGGPGGYTAALRLARAGRSVVLVERDRLGGVCLNTGCIPSKALLHAAAIADRARQGGPWGVDATVAVDLARTRAALDGVVGRLTGGIGTLLADAGVRVVHGSARLSTAHRIAVDTGDGVEHLETDHVIIATGSRPVALDAVPFDGARVVDAAGLLTRDRLPASLAVVGGGYIGVELGTAYAQLGVPVTIVEQTDRLLPGTAPWLVAPVARRLAARGVTVHTEATVEGLDDEHLVVSAAGSVHRVSADLVLVAAGRRPNTDGLGLDRVRVVPGADGRLAVDAARRTTAPHVLAIGDVTPGPALAHKATAEAEVAARTVLGQRAAFDPRCTPAVVFSDPEIASVGWTLDEARVAGAGARAFRFPLRASGRALTAGDVDGAVELVADADGTVLGGHAVGPGVSELAGELALAVEFAASAEDVALTIHPHPTISEAIVEAAHGLLGHPLHVTRPDPPRPGR
jgi:dihydrolipoamide dehydrogenase